MGLWLCATIRMSARNHERDGVAVENYLRGDPVSRPMTVAVCVVLSHVIQYEVNIVIKAFQDSDKLSRASHCYPYPRTYALLDQLKG